MATMTHTNEISLRDDINSWNEEEEEYQLEKWMNSLIINTDSQEQEIECLKNYLSQKEQQLSEKDSVIKNLEKMLEDSIKISQDLIEGENQIFHFL